jgi:tRNA 2-thiouridine synthesizing protein E
MATFDYQNKSYELDSSGFLKDFKNWDKNFAKGIARSMGMREDLTKEQWEVINFIRSTFESTGRCPNFYETCRMCGLRLTEMKLFFPEGYLRGACKVAGITYKEGYIGKNPSDWPPYTAAEDLNVIYADKTYSTDVRGFLINPDEWDEYYAIYRAFDMKIPGGKLTDRHWQIINYLREGYAKNKVVPTVYQTCEDNNIDLKELELLFPDGYHRGAVKIAGLRAR